jgi:pimeloyl-ACP methyl ester carboxylesterase
MGVSATHSTLRTMLVSLASFAVAAAGCAGPSAPASPTMVATERASATAAPPSASSSPTQPDIRKVFSINDHNLFLTCQGSGSPTIVFVHGLGGRLDVWDDVTPTVRVDYRVCAFDRVNSGRSSTDAGRHTATDSAEDMAALIDAAGIQTPVVVVAASFGGEIALIYAAAHPADVRGMVLVDATLPLEADLDQAYLTPDQIAAVAAETDDNPEHVDFYAAYAEAGAALASLPDIPIVYMRATLEPSAPEWPAGAYEAALRMFMAGLPQGRIVDVASTHNIQVEVPSAVIDETRTVAQDVAGT